MAKVIPNYLEDKLCFQISDWASDWYRNSGSKPLYTTGAPKIVSNVPMTPTGKLRRWVDLNKVHCPYLAAVTNKLFSEFKLEQYYQGSILNYYIPGTKVGLHAHKLDTGKADLRFNILVQKPQIGGNPIVDNVTYCLNQTDLLIFDARKPHKTDAVEGTKDRILLSCIFVVPDTNTHCHPDTLQP